MITVKNKVDSSIETRQFATQDEFKAYLREIICDSCIRSFIELTGSEPSSTAELLYNRCGGELDIDDPSNLINWSK